MDEQLQPFSINDAPVGSIKMMPPVDPLPDGGGATTATVTALAPPAPDTDAHSCSFGNSCKVPLIPSPSLPSADMALFSSQNPGCESFSGQPAIPLYNQEIVSAFSESSNCVASHSLTSGNHVCKMPLVSEAAEANRLVCSVVDASDPPERWNSTDSGNAVLGLDAHDVLPQEVTGCSRLCSTEVEPDGGLVGGSSSTSSSSSSSAEPVAGHRLHPLLDAGPELSGSATSSSLRKRHCSAPHDCQDSLGLSLGVDTACSHSSHHVPAECSVVSQAPFSSSHGNSNTVSSYSHSGLIAGGNTTSSGSYDETQASSGVFQDEFCSVPTTHSADPLHYSSSLGSSHGFQSVMSSHAHVHHHPDDPQQQHNTLRSHHHHHLVGGGAAPTTALLSQNEAYNPGGSVLRQPNGGEPVVTLSGENYPFLSTAAAGGYYYSDYSAPGFSHPQSSLSSAETSMHQLAASQVRLQLSSGAQRASSHHHGQQQRTLSAARANAAAGAHTREQCLSGENAGIKVLPSLGNSANQLASSASVNPSSGAVVLPVKRPRGRPRKHPLPVPLVSRVVDDEDEMECAESSNAMILRRSSGSQPILRTSSTTSCGSAQDNALNTLSLDASKKASSPHSVELCAVRCIQALRALQAAYLAHSAQEVDKMPPQDEVAEEYLALGGPYTALALGLEVQHQHTLLLEKSLNEDIASSMASSIIQKFLRQPQQLVINLNASFVWTSLNPKVPVRDLAVSRYHIAALLNDSRVFVYRHRTQPLVRTRVSQWEHITLLDNRGIVAVRITSANLPENWRERYHRTKRLSLIKQIRQQLRANNVPLPPPDIFNPDDVTPEELQIFVEHHRMGILCCPTSALDPDWLPEPFVLAALDRTGVVRIAKCCGFFNYPMVVKKSTFGRQEGASYQQPRQLFNTINNAAAHSVPAPPYESLHFLSSRLSDPSVGVPQNLDCPVSIERTIVHVDRVEKQPQLSIPIKEVNAEGQQVKIRAQIQDVALAELTEASLVASSGSSPEVAMVLYALGVNEHSAFVKGKNLYIRFKNFPTGPTKIYCGPLGHSGAVLLANGTVWTWMAQAKAPGSSNGKLGVVISQVGGSLEGKIVLDLMAIGADFVALTADGVVHEWNCYAPYTAPGADDAAVTIPQSLGRPSIPEPIELTPDFKSKVMSRRSAERMVYKAGHFSWGHNSKVSRRLDQETQVETKPCQDSSHDNAPDNTKTESTEASASMTTAASKCSKQEASADSNHSGSLFQSLQSVDETGAQQCDAKEKKESEANSNGNANFLEGFLPSLSAPYPFHLPSQSGLASKLAGDASETALRLPEVEETDADGWKDSDYYSEEALEQHRCAEIQRRYLSYVDPATGAADPIERIFLFEGVTMFLRTTSARFSYIQNDLACYRSGHHLRWREVYETNGGKHFNQEHAECFLRTFGDMGKPLVTNPVVIARMKLPSSEELRNDQLREQLELMAATNPPPYRLLFSPISLMVSILRHYDFVAEARRRLTLSLPVPIAAYDPRLYLEAFSGVPFGALDLSNVAQTLTVPPCQSAMGNETLPAALIAGESSDSAGPSVRPAYADAPLAQSRRGRGRVGRPRGSRAGVRTVLSHRRQPRNSAPDRATLFSTSVVPYSKVDEPPTSQQPLAAQQQEALSSSSSSSEAPKELQESRREQPSINESGQLCYFQEATQQSGSTGHANELSDEQLVQTARMAVEEHLEPSSSLVVTRKRTRRTSNTPRAAHHYYTTLAEKDGSDHTWDHILQMLGDEEDNGEANVDDDNDDGTDPDTDNKKRRQRRAKTARQRYRKSVLPVSSNHVEASETNLPNSTGRTEHPNAVTSDSCFVMSDKAVLGNDSNQAHQPTGFVEHQDYAYPVHRIGSEMLASHASSVSLPYNHQAS